ncbi:hypothetical protein O181_033754 [Austropuccinia psidii MF-1]|uniref:Uncharacterized protein n=1 Tax=Austropuccinia psidii MF-1 TaxID=1389203 RepID=A0A9Q3CZD8_9BASI|nr:hypothetical protein [Austropuccinia psidii MF-1]
MEVNIIFSSNNGAPLSNARWYLWSEKDGPFGNKRPFSKAPTPNGTLGHSSLTGSRQRDVASWTNVEGPIPTAGRKPYFSSEVPISRINSQGVVKRLRRIADSPTNPNAAGSDQLDGEELEVVQPSIGHQYSTSPSQPASKRFQSDIIPSTPRKVRPVLSTIPSSIPPASLNPSTARPSLDLPWSKSAIPHSRNSPKVIYQKLQPVASSIRRREERSPLPFPAGKVFQRRE